MLLNEDEKEEDIKKAIRDYLPQFFEEHKDAIVAELGRMYTESQAKCEIPTESHTVTNREWMQSLSDRDLAKFLTIGLPVKGWGGTDLLVTIRNVANRYTKSDTGLVEWFSEPKEFDNDIQ